MKLQYRREIDGLRALAILSVLIYHTEIDFGKSQFLKGGFLGVDVFFVISGFLITSIILSEYHRTGHFSISNFYERRARRLLPVLLAIMLVSLPFAWLYLFPTQLIDFSKSLISSLLFGSNFYWHGTLQEYGAESSLIKPFLHTWSLAVEEQYYIIFPLILIGFYRWCKSHTVVLLTFALLVSLLFAELMVTEHASFSFYMLPSRFWELLSGGLLANILYLHPQKDHDALLSRTMPTIGLCLIVFSLLFTEFNSNHPGFVTLPSVIGTILVIWFANENDMVTKVLASRWFVGTGLISYSLYLWHYPIFAFGRIIESNPSSMSKVSWFALTVILSIFTYFFIETPFRKNNVISRNILFFSLLTSSLLVVVFSLYTIQSKGMKERFPDLVKIYGKNEFDNKVLTQNSWDILSSLAKKNGFSRSLAHAPSEYEKTQLWYSSNRDNVKVLIIGNSHSKDLFNAFYQNKELFYDEEFARFGMHNEINDEQIRDLILAPNFKESDVILISFRYKNYTLDRLPYLIKKLKEHGKRVLVASNTVEFYDKQNIALFDWYAQNLPEKLLPDELHKLFFDNINLERSNVNLGIKMIAMQESVGFLDKYQLICNDNKRMCEGTTPAGYKSFYDYGHYTLEGAKYFGERIYETGWIRAVM